MVAWLVAALRLLLGPARLVPRSREEEHGNS